MCCLGTIGIRYAYVNGTMGNMLDDRSSENRNIHAWMESGSLARRSTWMVVTFCSIMSTVLLASCHSKGLAFGELLTHT